MSKQNRSAGIMSVAVVLCSLAASVASLAVPIDLGDIAVGGNGYGTSLDGWGVRVSDGSLIAPWEFGGEPVVNNGFVSVASPFVDGVFLPDLQTQINSLGGSFTFPNTQGIGYDALRASRAFRYPGEANVYRIRLNDQPGVNRRGLGAHSNGGITYDLEAMRQNGYGFTRVEGVAGMNYTAPAGQNRPLTISVLVDGVIKFQQTFIQPGENLPFSVAIPQWGRFLTVASSDVYAQINSRHGVIADLVLVPEPSTLAALATLLAVMARRRSA